MDAAARGSADEAIVGRHARCKLLHSCRAAQQPAVLAARSADRVARRCLKYVRSLASTSRQSRVRAGYVARQGGRRIAPTEPAMTGFAAASQNSLRAPRPLRSNSCDESVHEARKRAGRKTGHRRRLA
jgi:hypothetical protein